MKNKLSVLLATWFYTGLIPPIILKGMAGTYGSLAAIPVVAAIIADLHFTPVGVIPSYFINTIITFSIGVKCIPNAEKMLGPRKDWKGEVKTRDQNQIVIDEVFGMFITCTPILFLPTHPWWMYAAAFTLFRIFDIIKIPPTKYFDRQHTAFGVMMDDCIAGIYAALCLWGIIALFY